MPKWLTGSQLQAKEATLYRVIQDCFDDQNASQDQLQISQLAGELIEHKGMLLPNYYNINKSLETLFDNRPMADISSEVNREKCHINDCARQAIKQSIEQLSQQTEFSETGRQKFDGLKQLILGMLEDDTSNSLDDIQQSLKNFKQTKCGVLEYVLSDCVEQLKEVVDQKNNWLRERQKDLDAIIGTDGFKDKLVRADADTLYLAPSQLDSTNAQQFKRNVNSFQNRLVALNSRLENYHSSRFYDDPASNYQYLIQSGLPKIRKALYNNCQLLFNYMLKACDALINKLAVYDQFLISIQQEQLADWPLLNSEQLKLLFNTTYERIEDFKNKLKQMGRDNPERKFSHQQIDELYDEYCKITDNYKRFEINKGDQAIKNGIYFNEVYSFFEDYISQEAYNASCKRQLPEDQEDPNKKIPDDYDRNIAQYNQALKCLIDEIIKKGQFHDHNEEGGIYPLPALERRTDRHNYIVKESLNLHFLRYIKGLINKDKLDRYVKSLLPESIYQQHSDDLKRLPQKYTDSTPSQRVGRFQEVHQKFVKDSEVKDKDFRQHDEGYLKMISKWRDDYIQFLRDYDTKDLLENSDQLKLGSIVWAINVKIDKQPCLDLLQPITSSLSVTTFQLSSKLLGKSYLQQAIDEPRLRKFRCLSTEDSRSGEKSRLEQSLPQKLSCTPSFDQQNSEDNYGWQVNFIKLWDDSLAHLVGGTVKRKKPQRPVEDIEAITQQDCALILFMADLKLLKRLCEQSNVLQPIQNAIHSILDDLEKGLSLNWVCLYKILSRAHENLVDVQGMANLKSLIGNMASVLLYAEPKTPRQNQSQTDYLSDDKIQHLHYITNINPHKLPLVASRGQEKMNFGWLFDVWLDGFNMETPEYGTIDLIGEVDSDTWSDIWSVYLEQVYNTLTQIVRDFLNGRGKRNDVPTRFPGLVQWTSQGELVFKPFECWRAQFSGLAALKDYMSKVAQQNYDQSRSKNTYDKIKEKMFELGLQIVAHRERKKPTTIVTSGRNNAASIKIDRSKLFNKSEQSGSSLLPFNTMAKVRSWADVLPLPEDFDTRQWRLYLADEFIRTNSENITNNCKELGDQINQFFQSQCEALRNRQRSTAVIETDFNDLDIDSDEDSDTDEASVDYEPNDEEAQVDLNNYLPRQYQSTQSVHVDNSAWQEAQNKQFDFYTITETVKNELYYNTIDDLEKENIASKLYDQLTKQTQIEQALFMKQNRFCDKDELTQKRWHEFCRQRVREKVHFVRDQIHKEQQPNEMQSYDCNLYGNKQSNQGNSPSKTYLAKLQQRCVAENDLLTDSLYKAKRLYKERVIDYKEQRAKSGCFAWLKRCFLRRRKSYENVKNKRKVEGLKDYTQMIFGSLGQGWCNNSLRCLAIKSLLNSVNLTNNRPEYYQPKNSQEDRDNALFKANLGEEDDPARVFGYYIRSCWARDIEQSNKYNSQVAYQFIEAVVSTVFENLLNNAGEGAFNKKKQKDRVDKASRILGALEESSKQGLLHNANISYILNSHVKHLRQKKCNPIRPVREEADSIETLVDALGNKSSMFRRKRKTYASNNTARQLFSKITNSQGNDESEEENQLCKLITH